MGSDWRPVLDRIDDVVAEDVWFYKNGNRHKLVVGRPAPVPVDVGKPDPTWYCPLYIEGITPRIKPVFGAGPVDALMNAMRLVHSFFRLSHGIDDDENDERILNELKNPPE
jgi:hypothetical protein